MDTSEVPPPPVTPAENGTAAPGSQTPDNQPDPHRAAQAAQTAQAVDAATQAMAQHSQVLHAMQQAEDAVAQAVQSMANPFSG